MERASLSASDTETKAQHFMTSTDKPIDEAELAQLGITRVQIETFHWGNYRYSNARDAIAAAKRAQRA